MHQDIFNQISKHIVEANVIGVVLPQNITLDQYCCAVAISQYVNSINKNSLILNKNSLIFSTGNKPQTKFLNKEQPVLNSFSANSELLISISNKRVNPSALRYEKTSGGLEIFINSSDGVFTTDDVTVLPPSSKPDLLIILDAPSYQELGNLYTENSNVFLETKKVAISTNPAHTYFASTNLVDAEVSSVAEIVFQFMEFLNYDLLQNQEVSTALLAGIISQTQSFRSSKTKPATFSAAAKLIRLGAKQQDIIRYLFKTKPYNFLQLWGRALARLQQLQDAKFVFTTITLQDLQKTNQDTQSTIDILKDLIDSSVGIELFAIIVEQEHGCLVYMAGLPHINLRKIIKAVNGSLVIEVSELQNNFIYTSFDLQGLSIAEAEQFIIDVNKNRVL